jgi:hypothetical protein
MVMFDAAAPAGRHVVLLFLQLVGVSTPQQLIGDWRYALIAIVVIAGSSRRPATRSRCSPSPSR